MPFSLGSQVPQQNSTGTAFYPDQLLPSMQSALAMLADLDTRYEVERDYLEEWIGPDAVKGQLMAALEAGWQRDREPIVGRLTRLQNAVPDELRARRLVEPDKDASAQWFNSATRRRSPL